MNDWRTPSGVFSSYANLVADGRRERNIRALMAGTYKPRMRPYRRASLGWCVSGLGCTVYADKAVDAYDAWLQRIREALA